MKTLPLIIQSYPYERDIETSKFNVTYVKYREETTLKNIENKKIENRYPIIKIEVI